MAGCHRKAPIRARGARVKHSLMVVAAGLAVLTIACGGGDKPAPSPSNAPPTVRAALQTATPASTPALGGNTATPIGASDFTRETAISSLFGAIFNGALDGEQGLPAGELGEGDPALTEYLPPNSALPDGYAPVGQYTLRAPDGISETGGIDIAAALAMSGDPESQQADLLRVGVLMALVMKPDDLQSLGDVFDSIRGFDEQELEDALTAGTGTEGIFTLEDVKVFQTEGLGDGNVAMQMTINLGGFGALFGGLGGDAAAATGADSSLKLTMRLYLFARGDYAGGLLRMAFADSLADDVDEAGLAKLIDDKLKDAP